MENHVPESKVAQADTIISYAQSEGSSRQATPLGQPDPSQTIPGSPRKAFEIQRIPARLRIVTIQESQSNQRAGTRE
jgi:hypothetical protein